MDGALSIEGVFAARAAAAGKAERTRARLLDAAVTLFARDGFGVATAFDIAKAAGVANGTFYSYFRDREDIAHGVALGMAEITAERMAQTLPGGADARTRVAYATRRFVEEAAAHREWGRLLAQAVAANGELRGRITQFIRADVDLGVAQGWFQATVDQPLLDALGALTLAALAQRLNGAPASISARFAELQLAMLGVPAADAVRIAAEAAP
ncbi:MAG TPA: TetR/AcrR family transcriptional regulator [Phenylobacterium sp.]|nr:TetR/AcrR family transcriptional regulator [Phenylobacterium sp.]